IPDGLWVLHNCPGGDNPTCVQPAHLWLGTLQDNVEDMIRKGRHAHGATHGYHTNPASILRGEDRPTAKLTEAHVREMRALAATERWAFRELAGRYGVTAPAVSLAVRGITWPHLPGAVAPRWQSVSGPRAGEGQQLPLV